MRGVEFDLMQENSGLESGQKLREVKSDEMYRLVFNDFLAGGGDSYPYLLDHPKYVQTTLPCIDIVKNI